MKMNAMDMIVWILLFVGGLNWGLVGAFDYNLVESILGGTRNESSITMIVYILVGVAAIWSLISMFTKKSSSAPSTGTMPQ
jgi:uncharacterized membrane protein YuzA (DUF378 family)